MTLRKQPPSRLMPIDYAFIGPGAYPVEFVFFFDYRIDTQQFKVALDNTIPYFHLISSQLVAKTASSFELKYHANGLSYESEVIYDEMSTRAPHSRLSPVVTRLGEPLTRIRLTQYAEGTALGISVSHLVADGLSCFYFLTQLARAYQGKSLEQPDFRREWYLTSRSSHTLSRVPEDLFELTGFSHDSPRQDMPHDKVVREQLHFSQAYINNLLLEARRTASVHLSANDVITAKLWQTYVSRWHRSQPNLSHPPRITIPYDVRRFPNWVNDHYFGNGMCLAGGTYEGEHFATAPLGDLASIVRKTVNRIDRAYVQDAYDLLELYRQNKGQEAMHSLHTVDQNSGLMVTNLTRVPFDNIDFGQGRAFRFNPTTTAPRTAVLLPADDGVRIDVTYP